MERLVRRRRAPQVYPPRRRTHASRSLQSAAGADLKLSLYRFPDLDYFRDARVQADLTNILYVHAASYPQIGYRQGMHELLASLYIAVDYDSLDPTSPHPNLNADLLEMCNRTWVAADAWSMFEVVMDAVNPWYEWQEPQSALPRSGQVELKPYVAPIVAVCNRIHGQYLHKVDPALWEKMNDAGIEPQIYGM